MASETQQSERLLTFEIVGDGEPCGGRWQVVAVVSDRRTAEEVLRNMGLLPRPAGKTPRPGHSPPQLRLAV